MGTIDHHWKMWPGNLCHVWKRTWSAEQAWVETVQEVCWQGQNTATFGEQCPGAQRFGQTIFKFGVCVPCNKKEATMLDRENGNAHCQDLFEHKAFKDLRTNAAVPMGHQLIKLHVVFDIKQFLK